MKHYLPRLFRLLAACACLLLARCGPADLLNATIATGDLTVLRDVAYAPGPRGMLDVYRPAKPAAPLPVVVFFYGGAWQHGSRANYVFVAAELARRGMVVVVPDYRLSPAVRFPAFVQDAAQAVAFTRRMAAGWGGDPDRVVLAGHSAGAHIAAMLALDPRFLADAGDDRDALAGMVGLAGPYDFLPFTSDDIRQVFAGTDAAATQPISFADGRNPPMLLLHGTADRTVYLRNTVNLAAAITRRGGPVQVETYDGVGHVGIVTALAPLFSRRAPVLDDIAGFVGGLAPVQ